jgi:hypothetical protein
MHKLLIVLGLSGLMLAACSEDRAPQPAEKTAAMPAENAMPAAPTSRKLPSGPGVIDHSQDEREFELRRSLAGTERMIEQYRKDGYDTSELEARKAELEKKLQQLSG